ALDALSSSRAEQQKLIVDRHNALRRGVKPTASNMMKMEWSPPAAENAQNWANQCTLGHSPPNMRRTNVTCGENLYISSASLPWTNALQAWSNEEKNFKYGTGAKTKDAMTGHYTQLIWYNSYKVGCGFSKCPVGPYKYFYVCQYCPAGNNPMQIAMPYRSGPKCADCPGHCDKGLCTNPCKYQDLLENCTNLKMVFGCRNSVVKKKCLASCKCTTEII
ncbi:CRIS2 protein, partial [Malurus elegans]|nr:CRIS2 protein [Malurus elegans]